MACSLLFALLLCEGGLRIAGVQLNASLYSADPELGWVLRPGASGWNVIEGEAFLRVNRLGQLDPERSYQKPAGVLRIAFIGDSLVEARQVAMDSRFTRIMERELARCGLDRVEVLNFGVPGYGTAQELLQLRSRVWKYNPDIVLLGVYLGNDLFDNHPALDYTTPELRPYFRLQDARLVFDDSYRRNPKLAPRAIRLHDWVAGVVNRSRVLMLLRHVRIAMQTYKAPENVSGGGKIGFDDVFRPPAHPHMQEAWRVTEALCLEIRNEVRGHKAKFAMVSFPMNQQIDGDSARRENFRRTLGEQGDLDYASKRLAALAAREQIAFLDLGPPLLDYAIHHGAVSGFKNTQPNAGHLNELGHRVAGEALTAFVCRGW